MIYRGPTFCSRLLVLVIFIIVCAQETKRLASSDRKFGGICWGNAMMNYSGLVEKGFRWPLQVSDGSFRMGTSSVFGQQSSAQID